jgi:hypothetical protein
VATARSFWHFKERAFLTADELERQMEAQATDKFTLIDGKRLRKEGMKLASLSSASALNDVSRRADNMKAPVISNFRKQQGSMLSLRHSVL